MKENQTQEVKTVQKKHDYFLYFSYIILIAVIIFLFQNGVYDFIYNLEPIFTTIKQYAFAAFLVVSVFFVLYNFLTILGFILCYALFQFAMHLLEKSNF